MKLKLARLGNRLFGDNLFGERTDWMKWMVPWMLVDWLIWVGNCGVFVTSVQFSSVQSLSHVRLFATPWIAARQASLSITNSGVYSNSCPLMPSNHRILCHPLLLLPSIFPSIRVFSSESVLHIRWPKYCSFSFSIRPSNEYSGLISFRMELQNAL